MSWSCPGQGSVSVGPGHRGLTLECGRASCCLLCRPERRPHSTSAQGGALLPFMWLHAPVGPMAVGEETRRGQARTCCHALPDVGFCGQSARR